MPQNKCLLEITNKEIFKFAEYTVTAIKVYTKDNMHKAAVKSVPFKSAYFSFLCLQCLYRKMKKKKEPNPISLIQTKLSEDLIVRMG